MMPSLSVVQTLPSRRRNEAPALSSPPNAIVPSSRPGTNHLKPDRHLGQAAPGVGGHPVDDEELTRVLPTAASAGQPSRWRKR